MKKQKTPKNSFQISGQNQTLRMKLDFEVPFSAIRRVIRNLIFIGASLFGINRCSAATYSYQSANGSRKTEPFVF